MSRSLASRTPHPMQEAVVEASPNNGAGSSANVRLFRALADVFQKAQSTYAGHRRHISVLKRIQAKAIEQGYEEVFNYWFNKLVVLVLPLRRAEPAGDRIVRLVGGFIASSEQDVEQARATDETTFAEQEEQLSRFIDQFVRHILRGIESKDKNVRYRVTQLLAVIMDNLGEISEDLYNLITWSLEKRVHDKEPSVRVQTIFCLTKFQDEDGDSIDPDSATASLVTAIQHDPSPEVRRASMLNLVLNNQTQEYIFERARDVNPVNRRLVFSRILRSMGKKVFADVEIESLNRLLSWGLDDRDESVRNACVRLVAFDWLNIMDGDVIQLLSYLQVSKTSSSDKVVNAILESRPDIISKIQLPSDIWDDVSTESAFLIKSLYLFCIKHKLDDVIDKNFPEATSLSQTLQKYLDKRYSQEGLSAKNEQNLEFVILQLFSAASEYDYSDEMGRRAMLNLIRNSLARFKLPEPLIQAGLKVLRALSINERDFITMSVEIITDLRDEDIERQEQADEEREIDLGDDEERPDAIESFNSAVENLAKGVEEPQQENIEKFAIEKEAGSETLMICLVLSRYMLELINTPLPENILIYSLIDTLIRPAVRNTQPEIRQLGLRNLGLCCILDVELAAESMFILGMCVSKGDPSLKNIALQVIVDVFSVHGSKVVDGEGKVDSISLHKIFYKVLKNHELPECQAIAAEGLCKLFLGDVFVDDDLFETLVLSCFSPANAKNEALVQAFAFCLPVYCFSHRNHQKRMARVASDVFLRLTMLWDDLQKGECDDMAPEAMLRPGAILQQLIHWTDPSKLVNQSKESDDTENYQLDFLLNVLKIYNRFERKDVKKMLLTNINKITLTSEDDLHKLEEIREILQDIDDNDNIDVSSHKSIKKIVEHVEQIITEAKSEKVEEDSSNQSEDEYSAILSTTGENNAHTPPPPRQESFGDPHEFDSPMDMSRDMIDNTPSRKPSREVGSQDMAKSRNSTVPRTRKRSRENTSSQRRERIHGSDNVNRTVSFILPSDDNSVTDEGNSSTYDS
ncbi:LAMI_0C04390g1_1 [Lachancea mirantina]|uniref:LAMI_0C04390g1_1 n=1 Tax=Lachancea mirantina TaxID=1230905 RepID=A0A1G4J256_9SACH|nr:LAMI_0C04390g1_1 [Lachancea mirantina]